jgi:hypothetical protein
MAEKHGEQQGTTKGLTKPQRKSCGKRQSMVWKNNNCNKDKDGFSHTLTVPERSPLCRSNSGNPKGDEKG